ncbi:MAG: SRPBCC family protein, partial [Thermoleophilia bacterium]|nr:SRPBCC family protein [Thermoleophilia bacterium]
MATVELTAANMSDASVERVWALLSDQASWADWGLWDSVTIDQPGTTDPNGVGLRKTLTFKRTASHEEVIAYDSLTYALSYRL